jgi:hypothetical protein
MQTAAASRQIVMPQTDARILPLTDRNINRFTIRIQIHQLILSRHLPPCTLVPWVNFLPFVVAIFANGVSPNEKSIPVTVVVPNSPVYARRPEAKRIRSDAKHEHAWIHFIRPNPKHPDVPGKDAETKYDIIQVAAPPSAQLPSR